MAKTTKIRPEFDTDDGLVGGSVGLAGGGALWLGSKVTTLAPHLLVTLWLADQGAHVFLHLLCHVLSSPPRSKFRSPPPKKLTCQGALKGTNLRGQTEPFRRFSQISLLFWQILAFSKKIVNKAFGKRRFPEKRLIFAGNSRKPHEPAEFLRQKTADWRLSL